VLPINHEGILQMIDDLRSAKLLSGHRGAPAADRDRLAGVIAAIARAASALGPDLVALDINPLRVYGSEIEALDALCVWRDTP